MGGLSTTTLGGGGKGSLAGKGNDYVVRGGMGDGIVVATSTPPPPAMPTLLIQGVVNYIPYDNQLHSTRSPVRTSTGPSRPSTPRRTSAPSRNRYSEPISCTLTSRSSNAKRACTYNTKSTSATILAGAPFATVKVAAWGLVYSPAARATSELIIVNPAPVSIVMRPRKGEAPPNIPTSKHGYGLLIRPSGR